ncbi:MAG TPA: hypothetical protein VK927_03295 [Adhaeribacter sp.]|nr:hypothetical protein [Adhaeribacter sp.]
MKKSFLLFLFLFAFAGHHRSAAQEQTTPEYNRFKIKSIGFSAMWGMEKYFKPLNFAYFEQNSQFGNPGLYQHPPGATDNPRRPEYDTPPLGLSLQVAWPVGKNRNEFRMGFGFQEHWNSVSESSYYFPTPDVYRYHQIRLVDDYVISQLTFDYAVHAKPILKVASLFGTIGGTFGASTRHSHIRTETIINYDTTGLRFQPNGYGFASGGTRTVTEKDLHIRSKVRFQTGLRATAGIEFQLSRFGIPIGLGGFWGYGIITQNFLNGGTMNHKWTEFAQVQARYFLY